MEIDWRIIRRWALGIASSEELEQLENWKKEDAKKQAFLKRVSTYYAYEPWIDDPSSRDMARVWKKLDPNRSKRTLWIRRARAIAAVLLVGIGIWYVREQILINEILSKKLDGNSVFLILADGSRHELDQETSIEALIHAVKIDSSAVQKKKQIAKLPPIPKYHEIVVPRGAEYHLTLADGSVVHLNAESSLRFPEQFGLTRTVYLSGEAYFEVMRDTTRPFYVEFGQTKVEVLGTQFNVKAYPTAPSFTTLVEGSVAVRVNDNQLVLQPGEQCEVNPETGEMQVTYPDIMSVVAWKNGEFIFRDVALEVMMDELSRWYDVAIEYETEELKKLHFSLYVGRSETLVEVLEKIALTNWIYYQVDNRKITIKKR